MPTPEEFRIDVFRAGPHCSVWVIHLPTGLVAERHEVTSQHRAQEACIDELCVRLQGGEDS